MGINLIREGIAVRCYEPINFTMNERTRNEIALWLLDRVAQGEHEEEGSMDSCEFGRGYGRTKVWIMKDSYGYCVWLGWYAVPDFTLTPKSTENDIRRMIDEC